MVVEVEVFSFYQKLPLPNNNSRALAALWRRACRAALELGILSPAQIQPLQQACWIEFLQDFDYTLEHIAGTTNTIADLLSRRKDLNKGVDSDLPRIPLPDHLFSPPSLP